MLLVTCFDFLMDFFLVGVLVEFEWVRSECVPETFHLGKQLGDHSDLIQWTHGFVTDHSLTSLRVSTYDCWADRLFKLTRALIISYYHPVFGHASLSKLLHFALSLTHVHWVSLRLRHRLLRLKILSSLEFLTQVLMGNSSLWLLATFHYGGFVILFLMRGRPWLFKLIQSLFVLLALCWPIDSHW